MSDRDDMRIWILPSRPDPEAAAIEAILTECGEECSGDWDDRRVAEARWSGGLIVAIERDDIPPWTGVPCVTACWARRARFYS